MRYFETRKARIEIIPMIDIMLFLLVFFAMMTLRMIPSTGQVSKLPTSSTAQTMAPPKLTLEIHEVSPFRRTTTAASDAPTVIAWSSAGAPTGSMECHTRSR